MEALCNKDFVALLQNKAKYDEYLKGFRLPQFGTWRTIQAEGSDDSIPDGLTKALMGRIQGKQKALQEFWLRIFNLESTERRGGLRRYSKGPWQN